MFEVANINRASTRDFWITVNLIFDKENENCDF